MAEDVGPSPDEPTPPPNPPLPVAQPSKTLTIVVVGKCGAGKSTLIANLLGEEQQLQISPNAITSNIEFKIFKKNGVTLKIYDTVGLETIELEKEMATNLKELSSCTRGQADLVVFCICVSPGLKFNDSNPAIMRSLQTAYGKDIWKHCIVAFTMSNVAWNLCKGQGDTQMEVAQYKEYIQAYANSFQEELQRLGVSDVEVETPFSQERTDKHIISAIPVGGKPDDNILPGIQLDTDQQWKGYFLLQTIQYCNQENQENLLKYLYGYKLGLKKALKITGVNVAYVGVGGAILGAVGGAVGGALEGAAAGPTGIVVGGIVGAAVDAGIYGTLWSVYAGVSTVSVLAVKKVIEKLRRSA